MEFQFTNTKYGSKNIFKKTLNDLLNQNNEFKNTIIQRIINSSMFEGKEELLKEITKGSVSTKGMEDLKNGFLGSITMEEDGQNVRVILQEMGDVLRGQDPKMFLYFMGVDLLEELESRTQKIDLKTLVGGAGVGKGTISKYFFDSTTDVRTTNEINFLIQFNLCKTKEDQQAYLKTFLSGLSIDFNQPQKQGLFETTLYDNVAEALKIFTEITKDFKKENYKQEKETDALVSFIDRPILNRTEFAGSDNEYKEYIDDQKQAYKGNYLEWNEKNRRLFGYIRSGVNIHHYTEKLNSVIRLFITTKDSNPTEIKKEFDYLMGLGNISEDQKKEFADFFAYLMKNPEIINVIENKDFNATINDLIMKMFKSAISYTEKDFKSTELHVERLKKEPQKLVRETNIYFDFDDVIVNFVPEWIEWINTRLEAEGLEAGYTIDDVRNFWWFNQLGDTLVEKGLDTQKINAIIWEFLQSDIYQNIEHHNNTINIMRYLKGVGFNVKILSAGVSRSKEKFVEEHLTFLDAKKDMIITANKSIVQPGVLVDDGGHNAVEMVENNNMAYCVLIDTKYNQHIQTGKRITRVKLEDTKQVLNLILAKAYSNEARKHNFSLILKDLGYDLPEGLENKSIDAVLKMLGEMSLPSKTSSKNKE